MKHDVANMIAFWTNQTQYIYTKTRLKASPLKNNEPNTCLKHCMQKKLWHEELGQYWKQGKHKRRIINQKASSNIPKILQKIYIEQTKDSPKSKQEKLKCTDVSVMLGLRIT